MKILKTSKSKKLRNSEMEIVRVKVKITNMYLRGT